jgi:hypothetical protein
VAAAVQGAVPEAVTLAVQAAVQEVLASPEFLDRLRAATVSAPADNPKPAPAGPGVFARMATTLKGSHAKYVVFQLAEVAVPRQLFAGILERITRLCPAHASG